MMPYERLDAWAACHRLLLAVYRSTQTWPASERYGLTAQVRSAALSAASNIAEGASRRTPADCARFLDISMGSLAELAYQLLVARDLGLLGEAEHSEIMKKHQAAGRLTWCLYAAKRRRVKAGG